MNRKLNIVLDFDDTIGSFTGLWVQAFNHLFPDKKAITHLDINRWQLKEIGEITDEELQETFKWIRAQNYDLVLHPVDKLFEYWLNRIRREGHNVRILTANPPEVIPKIKRWLACYGVKDIEVISVSNSAEKMNYEWDVIVDDSPEIIKLCTKGGRKFITYAAQHNKKFNKNVEYLALNWQNVYEHVSDISKGE